MESGPPMQADVLQVIPRRTPSGGLPPDGGGTGSRRISLPPERRKNLTRIVIGALGTCGVILIAAGIAHLLRRDDVDTPASAATSAAAMPPAPAAAPASPPSMPLPAATPTTDAPQTGTLRLLHPAVPGKVWLDGQKITAASATVACGDHQIKIGRAKAHTVNIPCGGDVKVAK
jgi:hypothetical protein